MILISHTVEKTIIYYIIYNNLVTYSGTIIFKPGEPKMLKDLIICATWPGSWGLPVHESWGGGSWGAWVVLGPACK